MPLAPNLATLVAVGNGHLLEYIFPYLGCCDQLSLFSTGQSGLNWNGASVQHISSPNLRNQVIRTCYIQ